jgi:hypothetical protein
MATATIGPALHENMTDKLRQAELYAEAARMMVEDARQLLEAVKHGDHDDG